MTMNARRQMTTSCLTMMMMMMMMIMIMIMMITIMIIFDGYVIENVHTAKGKPKHRITALVLTPRQPNIVHIVVA